ncbi:MAG: hypothetical protein JWM42_2751 [Burkholderia sp.]|nr:hypothetical protein [Burkholderia sp.]
MSTVQAEEPAIDDARDAKPPALKTSRRKR